MHRRTFILSSALAIMAAGGPAAALSPDAARAHVREAVDAVLALVQSGASTERKAAKLRDILDRYAAMPQIARFSAGLAWRDMSEAQQDRFTDAFGHYLSTVYARRFQDYSGETVSVGEVRDGGRRGLVVETTVTQPKGQPIIVEWLVSDRPGRTVIADIVIEGVSMLVTQREELSAMLDKRGGDVDTLISDLKSA